MRYTKAKETLKGYIQSKHTTLWWHREVSKEVLLDAAVEEICKALLEAGIIKPDKEKVPHKVTINGQEFTLNGKKLTGLDACVLARMDPNTSSINFLDGSGVRALMRPSENAWITYKNCTEPILLTITSSI